MAQFAIVKLLNESDAKLSEVIDAYLIHAASYKSPLTLRGVDRPTANSLRHHFADDPLASAISADSWIASLKKARLSPTSIRTRIVVARLFFEYAISENKIQHNPFNGVRLPRPNDSAGRYLEEHEIAAFMNLLPLPCQRACMLSLYTGLRRTEAISLDFSQVLDDWIVIPARRSKNGQGRKIWINPKAREFLGERHPGLVIGIDQWRLGKAITAAWRVLGIGRIRFHDMRHTWATNFWQETHDLWELMKQGGWKSPASCKIYQHGKPNFAAMMRVGYNVHLSARTNTI